MFGMKKKAHGIELIDEVMARFTTMIDELDEGANSCECEQTGIRSQIESLHQRNAILDSSIKRAVSIATNLRTLIGE